MSKQESDPLTQVDALVHDYLAQQAEQVDGAAGLARVQAAMAKPTQARSALLVGTRRRGIRLAYAASIAAAAALAFLGGWYLSPVHASPKDLVKEVQRVHALPLARCYLVEVQRMLDGDDDRALLGKPGRQVHIWTRGDRFWVEARDDEAGPPFIWGRGDNGSLWAVLDSHRGVRVPLEQAPLPLRRIADIYTLNVDKLLNEVLQDCTLTDEPAAASKLTRVVLANPQTERLRLWLGQATLEIDSEAKVLRRMVLVRNLLGSPRARVTFTLLETRADDDAKYRLEGHLAEPMRIHEDPIEPIVKLELLGRWLGVRNEGRDKKTVAPPEVPLKDVDGRAHASLCPSDKKATVLFFLLLDCPISNAYAPEIRRICSDYEPKKIAARVVHADPDVTAEQAKKHAREYGLPGPMFLDPTHALVKKTGVTMAPEVAVLAPDGKVLYHGRIDDMYADYGKRRAQPTQRDLRNALDAILQGKAVPIPVTKVIGCYLPEPSP